MEIGKIINEIRKQTKLTMRQVQEKTGVLASNQSKIETGDNAAPGFDTVGRLARFYNLSLDKLYDATLSDDVGPLTASGTRGTLQLPVLDNQKAAKWPMDKSCLKQVAEFIPSPIHCSEDAFALKVEGDAMTSPHAYQASFAQGDIIIIDPEREANDKDFVILTEGETEAAFFRQLVADGSKQYLRPLNTQFPVSEKKDEDQVLGVVIGKIQKF